MNDHDVNHEQVRELRYWLVEMIEELKPRSFPRDDEFGKAWFLARKVERLRHALGLSEIAEVCESPHGFWVDTSDPVFRINRSLGFGYNSNADEHNRGELRRNLESWVRYLDKSLADMGADPGMKNAAEATEIKPRWDRDKGRLYFDDKLIKTVRVARAKNVCLVLDSFEELNWRTRIDDPLPRGDEVDPARRRSETRDSLNRSLTVIRFSVNDQGFAWEPV